MSIQQSCIEAYRAHKNLKLAAQEVGIPWQTVYVHLRNAGEPVIGDKLRYGSDTDKLAARGEQMFASFVPEAHNSNSGKFQSKIDFLVQGYGVDVKTSKLKLSHKACKQRRWAFSLKKQEMLADFFVCFCLDEVGDQLLMTLLVPGELIRRYQTISLSERGGKWADYEISYNELRSFFKSLPSKQ
ncbi:hypothetical protein LX59_03020 [Azomonas agilis]|uniref:Uncharacterized protein n=1 Tax=Azomonas agilis TaxID=116849 RepID=A0A562HZ27_9GAMM|nr:hypothetical protein [Azomonas agilis]TWH63856.1 hypothetical protein LX59_03020 [Azomonas agilis]